MKLVLVLIQTFILLEIAHCQNIEVQNTNHITPSKQVDTESLDDDVIVYRNTTPCKQQCLISKLIFSAHGEDSFKAVLPCLLVKFLTPIILVAMLILVIISYSRNKSSINPKNKASTESI